jgi:2-haloacid dehalogenase
MRPGARSRSSAPASFHDLERPPVTSSDAGVRAVFFDLFGTLLSLAPLDEACDRLAPGRGRLFAALWRTRQLEASWLRTAMDRWVDFDVVTRDALQATAGELGIEAPNDLDGLANSFAELPLISESADVVRQLRAAGLATGVLTNASRRTLDHVSDRLDLPMDHLLSVDAARKFKPHPDVYRLAVEATGQPPERIGFVTANGWDAAGAGAFGFRVAWLRPSGAASLPAVGAPQPLIATWREIPGIFTP